MKTEKTENGRREPNIWQLKQYYYQSQLDTIHYHLVHSKWELYIQRFSNKHSEDDDFLVEEHESEIQNKTKYVTDLSDSKHANYGFGVDHRHPHLCPKFRSMHEELLFNTLCRLTYQQFINLLVKSIRLQPIATGPEYNYRCTHFNKEYNIIRNQLIGLRHILSIVIYTDITDFCTTYRSTYRKIKSDRSEEDVRRRHVQLFFYSRAIFEAIEYFGKPMETDLKVYHGLNKVMNFSQFTAYFNQPVSTTTELNTAVQFAAGAGIILTLKSGAEYFNDENKIPKYLPVSWLSRFPNENEKLFYGAWVVFRICNIRETEQMPLMVEHSRELQMLNKFQQMVQNQAVSWDKKDKQMIDALVFLIKKHQQSDADVVQLANKHFESKYITKYGTSLFNYFCQSPNTTKIELNNHTSLPEKLRTALLPVEQDKLQKQNYVSILPIAKLFTNLQRIIFTEINIKQMEVDSKKIYVDIALYHIKDSYKTATSGLREIKFMSKQQHDRKENSMLKKLMHKHSNKFQQNQWSIRYEFQKQNTHCLMFANYNKAFMQLDVMKGLKTIPNVFLQTNNQIPSYFLQITSVDENVCHIKISADKVSSAKRKLFVKEVDKSNIGVMSQININKYQISAERDIDIDPQHHIYQLAIYGSKKATEPVSNSTLIQLVITSDVNKLPPKNKNYKPNCINLESVIKINDDTNNKVNIYWFIPPNSFGDIAY
eukprot:20824_1